MNKSYLQQNREALASLATFNRSLKEHAPLFSFFDAPGDTKEREEPERMYCASCGRDCTHAGPQCIHCRRHFCCSKCFDLHYCAPPAWPGSNSIAS